MPELNKIAANDANSVVGALGICICVCICFIFTEKRHRDLLDAGYAVRD